MPTTLKKYKDESRKDWGMRLDDDETISHELIQLGAVLRIADATELMAKSHAQLVTDRDYWERRAKNAEAAAKRGDYRERNLKGQLTKLKKELEIAKAVQP